jgi:hypothetical protein
MLTTIHGMGIFPVDYHNHGMGFLYRCPVLPAIRRSMLIIRLPVGESRYQLTKERKRNREKDMDAGYCHTSAA